MKDKTAGMIIALAGLNGFLAVALGAYGAHGLEAPDAAALDAFRTGADYHLAHALALIGLVALGHRLPPPVPAWTAAAFLAGIALFCGSLYWLGVTGSRALVLATPLGGLAFLVGWALIAGAGLRIWRAAAAPGRPRNATDTR